MPLSTITVEDEVFLAEGQVGIGAVRQVRPDMLVVFVEGYGDIEVRPANISDAHDGKVLLKLETLDARLQEHLAHVHDSEAPDPASR